MFFNGDITYKEISSNKFSLIVTEPPTIIHSEVKDEAVSVPGRDGDLHFAEVTHGDAQIKVVFGLATSTTNYKDVIRQVRNWLQGNGRLVIGDATDSYYEVKKVNISNDSRVVVNVGTIEAIFTVYPYEFLNIGDVGVSGTGKIINLNSDSNPLYKIKGSGNGTLSITNSNGSYSMTFTSAGTLYIDTMLKSAYDSSTPAKDKSNKVGGDYNKMKLANGENIISITSGFTLTTYPRWGTVI